MALVRNALAEISVEIQKGFLIIYPALILFTLEDKKG